MLDSSYVKTDAGREEIKSRGLALSRSARNLLLVIDGTRSAAEWLVLVHGTVEADLANLLEHGLIAAARTATAPASAAQRQKAQFGDPPRLDYQALYALLNGQATKLLGLVKGYRFALDVEKCAGLPELQALALDFVERVEQAKGAQAAQDLREALGLTA